MTRTFDRSATLASLRDAVVILRACNLDAEARELLAQETVIAMSADDDAEEFAALLGVACYNPA